MPSNSIQKLNDLFRKTSTTDIYFTASLAHLKLRTRLSILKKMRNFSDFSSSNDPNGEHDFGLFVVDGDTYMWKIDYYDLSLSYGSEDPSDANITRRILTIMHSTDY